MDTTTITTAAATNINTNLDVNNDVSLFPSKPGAVSRDHFITLSLLGTGAFAKVYLVQHKQTLEYFAMKVMRKMYTRSKKKKDLNSFQPYTHGIRERDILASIAKHPFLVTLKYAFQDQEYLYLVLDWAQGGELWSFVAKENFLLEPDARFYLAEIVLALEHLHSLGIIYRDLKLENILIDNTGNLKLTDFGLSKYAFQEEIGIKANSFLGTPDYMAPEMIRRKDYDERIDWWGLGVLMYTMLVGQPPFSGKTLKDLEKNILQHKPKYPTHLTNEARDLINKLLHKDPNHRPNVNKIKQHRFFRSIQWQHLLNLALSPPYVPDAHAIHQRLEELKKTGTTHVFQSMEEELSTPLLSEVQLNEEMVTAFHGFSFAEF